MTYNMTAVFGDGEDGGELILTDLLKFQKYSIVIQAFNEVGNGPLSDPTTVQTMEDGKKQCNCEILYNQNHLILLWLIYFTINTQYGLICIFSTFELPCRRSMCSLKFSNSTADLAAT